MKADIERYARVDSPLRRWDARWKMVSLGWVAFAAATVRNPWIALAFTTMGLLILSSGKLPVRVLLRRLGEAHLLLIPCFLILPFTVPGETFTLLGFSMSDSFTIPSREKTGCR